MQGGTALRYELALTNVGSPALIFASLCNIDGVLQPANGCNNVTRGVGQGCASFGTVPGSSITGALQARVILVAAPSARPDARAVLKVRASEFSGEYGLWRPALGAQIAARATSEILGHLPPILPLTRLASCGELRLRGFSPSYYFSSIMGFP